MPHIMSTKRNRIRMSNSVGRELSSEDTRARIPFIELIVRRGLRILTTLIAETFWELIRLLTQPIMTTQKSS